MPTVTDMSSTRRTELILREIDSLPTLPAIATRLLSLTTSDDSHASDVIDLIRTDPSMTAKVLSLCHKASRGVAAETLTIDKAVVLLGFDTIRMAVLSIEVFEVFEQAKPNSRNKKPDGRFVNDEHRQFDRMNFWRHCLAVGIASEMIAEAHSDYDDLDKAEAFVCGLMHDLGKLALDYVLPQAYSRVVELTELNQCNIADIERKIIGLDHHTAGKRLAEQWGLPQQIHDCMWLHGSRYESLPSMDHRRLIGLVGLADLIVRRHHIGFSGNFSFDQDPAVAAAAAGLNPKLVESITYELHEVIQKKVAMLDLDDEPSTKLFVESIKRANQALGRLSTNLERRSRTATQQATILDAISVFQSSGGMAHSVRDALDAVVANAYRVLGPGHYSMLCQTDQAECESAESWLLCHYNYQAEPTHSEFVEPPEHSPDLSSLQSEQPVTVRLASLLPWITSHLCDVPDIQKVRLLPLSNGYRTSAVLLHDRDTMPSVRDMSALISCWGTSVSNAAHHEATRRLGEELAEANRALAEAQDQLLHKESMARLGEMAAGAAHEMNNPLAVISGRAQLLTMTLKHGSKSHNASLQIVEQAQRITDLITSLRMFSDPPKATRRATDLGSLLSNTVNQVKQETSVPGTDPAPVSLKVQSPMPVLTIDPDQIGAAVRELLLNAIQANSKSDIYIYARIDPASNWLVIQVVDSGPGMDSHTLDHALDPFFSAKPAGRQVGMGLARANHFVTAHGGRLDLRSAPGEGTTATLAIPLDSPL